MHSLENKVASGYGNESIDTIDGERNQVCSKPNIYFGTSDAFGSMHGLFELVMNAVDEARAGNADRIRVRLNDDGTREVHDNGRGVPMGYNNTKKQYNYYLVYCRLYASGKYNTDNYKKSSGLNGVGAAITQFASDFMTVTAVRDEPVEFYNKTDANGNRIPKRHERIKYTMHFKDGYEDGKLKVERGVKEDTGTNIKYKPSDAVFKSNVIPMEHCIAQLNMVAMLNPGLTITFEADGKSMDIFYKRGMSTYIENVCKGKLTKNTIDIKGSGHGVDNPNDDPNGEKSYDAEVEVSMTFTRQNGFILGFHNGGHVPDGGTGVEGVKAAVLRVLDEQAHQRGKIGKREHVQFKDIEEILAVVISTDCPGFISDWQHQTKREIKNPFIKELAVKVVYENFTIWAAQHQDEMTRIVDEVLINKTARERANEIKKSVIKKMTQDINSISGKPEKLKPCELKGPAEKLEIYIVEGDSAGNIVLQARDGKTQAVLPLRGKIMNCEKKRIEDILSSDIILQFIQTVGCGIEAKSKHIELPPFDITKLNYGKIILCTDADVDGSHITTLLLVMIYRLMPTLIKEGHVYIVESPLYLITVTRNKQEEMLFAYDDIEKAKVLKQLEQQGVKEKHIHIDRLKGLGESSKEMMEVTTMNPETRRLIKVEYDEKAGKMIHDLMGEELAPRKKMIADYFKTFDYSSWDSSELPEAE